MNYSDYQLMLDIHEIGSQVYLTAKQGDTNRRICVSLVENGVPYQITGDCIAVFTAKKPDGNIIFNNCTIADNAITYEITEQTVAAVGELACELRLYGADNALLVSPRFTLNVVPAVFTDSEFVESVTEVSTLASLIGEAGRMVQEINTKLDGGDFIPKLTIGTVSTLPAGSMATAEFTGTGAEPVLNLGIPMGEQGQAESLIPDTELSLNSTKPVQNRVITAAINNLFVIGAEEPASGPALWLNTNYSPSGSDVALLSLDDDESGAAVVMTVDGEDYAVNNASVNGSPSGATYDFTII